LEQSIKTLENEKASRATSEFKVLQDGLKRFRPFLIRNISYSWDDFRYYAARTALIMKMIKNNASEDKVEEILYANIPNRRGDILKLIEQVKTLPEEERWFIQLDEIGNFPKILKTWHDYFFLA